MQKKRYTFALRPVAKLPLLTLFYQFFSKNSISSQVNGHFGDIWRAFTVFFGSE